MPWFQSYRGHPIDVSNPSREVVDIEDIAHALSMTCRFGGHCRDFYSVAEHSVLVEEWGAEVLCKRNDMIRAGELSRARLCLLLHDAAEAYVGDVITPVKKTIPEFKELEDRWLLSIGSALGLGDALVNPSPVVKLADDFILSHEVVSLYSSIREEWWECRERPKSGKVVIHCWQPAEARRQFLARYRELAEDLRVLCPYCKSCMYEGKLFSALMST